MDLEIVYRYPREANRAGAYCSVLFESAGAAGSYEYLVDSASRTARAGSTASEGVGIELYTTAPSLDDIGFLFEQNNHRFLYAGTGGTNFGTCQFDSSNPNGPAPSVLYSGGPGPGWDCCTFQFDDLDGVPSSVGQLVFELGPGAGMPPDSDGDGFLSPCDSCDHRANVDQADHGGIQTDDPDQIGDACQCGEVTSNGIVDALDLTALRAHLAQVEDASLALDALSRCSSIGGPTECTIRTMVVIARALASLQPGVAQSCAAAQPS